MTIYQFIFSDHIRHRIFRHIVFWIVYCIFFYVQSIVPSDYTGSFSAFTFYVALLSVFHFVPACVLAVYVSIYYILPKFIVRRNVVKSIIAILLLFGICTVLNIYASYRFNKITPPDLQTPINFDIVLGLAYLNAAWAFTAGGVAIGIKVIKSWVTQQKALVEVQRSKTRTETELLKGRVLPVFLLSAVDTIKTKVEKDQQASARMIIILSDILSYILYDTADEAVECRKELFILQQFIELENLSHPNLIALEVDSRSVFNTRFIPPLAILSLVQNSIYTISGAGLSPCGWKIHIRTDAKMRLRMSCYFNDSSELALRTEYLQNRIAELQSLIFSVNSADIRMRVMRQSVVLTCMLSFHSQAPEYGHNSSRLDSQLVAYV